MRSRFDDFVTARGGVLWRTAWLLTGHADRAEELLGRALARVWSLGRDDRTAPGGLDDEALEALVRAYLPRRGPDERPTGSAHSEAAADPAWTADDEATVQERRELLTALGLLTRRQRAVVVLVHGERRTLAEVATLLGTRAEVVEAVHTEACAVLRETPLDPGEEDLLRVRLATCVPAPPYAPTRVVDAETRARRARRRTMLAAGVGGIALLALLVPALAAGLAADDPATTVSPASRPGLVGERPDIARPVPGRSQCPVDPMHPDTADRVAILDYPPTSRRTMPQPAVGAVFCRYEPRNRQRPRLAEAFPLSAVDAEQIRVAYLAQGQSPRIGCDHTSRTSLYAVVLVDATGSRWAFGFDAGRCGALAGTGSDVEYAGRRLVDLVRSAEPACEELPAGAVRLDAAL